MLDFGALPPEVNSGRMYLGAGSGPLLAAAAAWDALAGELQSTAASYGSRTSQPSNSPPKAPTPVSPSTASTRSS